MIYYYGIRPTGDNLHLGHVMSLLNMFDSIKNNSVNITRIYILIAEKHAEISNIPADKIHDNSLKLAKNISALFKSYIKINNIDCINLIDRLYFIYQNDESIGTYHSDITYKYLSLMNVNIALTNPIYKNSSNKSIAFLIYPILQAFDILLYLPENDDITVFVSGDQTANVNMIKDICTKLKIKNKIVFNIYDNVIYDYSCKEKMSKSLNNFVNFNDYDGIKKYINSYLTYPRPKIDTIGNYDKCEMYNNIATQFMKFMNLKLSHFILCNSGSIGCSECKTILFKYVNSFIDLYIYNISSDINNLNIVNGLFIKDNYTNILNKIDKIRSSNENC